MKQKMILTQITVFIITICSLAYTFTGGEFLNLPIGARGTAISAYTAVCENDVYAIFWNPASISYGINNLQVGINHTEWFEKMQQDVIAVLLPYRVLRGWLGFGITYFHIAEGIEYRSGVNEKLFGEIHPYTPLTLSERLFYAYGVSFILSYARRIYDKFPVGINVRVLQESIDVYKATTVSLDIGMCYEHKVYNIPLRYAFSIYNLSPGLRYLDNIIPLQLVPKLGVAAKVLDGKLLFSTELAFPYRAQAKFMVGSEYRYVIDTENIIYFRSGLRYNFTSVSWGKKNFYSLGVGANLGILNIDYTYADEQMGPIHQISVSLNRLPEIKLVPDILKEKRVVKEEVEEEKIAISSSPVSTRISLRQLTVAPYMNEYEVEITPTEEEKMVAKEFVLEKCIFRLRVPILETFSVTIYSLHDVPPEIKIYPGEKVYDILAIETKFVNEQLYMFEYKIKIRKDWCLENKFAANEIKMFGQMDMDRIYGDIISIDEDEKYYYYTIVFNRFVPILVILGETRPEEDETPYSVPLPIPTPPMPTPLPVPGEEPSLPGPSQ